LFDNNRQPFTLVEDGTLHQRLHQIDRDASGHIESPSDLADASLGRRYLVSGLVEEAIRSSQLEGAATTRRVAREMLRSERRPQTEGERMIFNNYRAMLRVREIAGEALDLPKLLALHQILVEGTIKPAACGRFRIPGERVEVVDNRDGEILYVPPDARYLRSRVAQLLEFANEREHKPFLHPVLKAALLHFMIGYEHPFVDGNGRIARALFYWSMVRDGYWLMEYLSISSLIRRAPTQYVRAYLFTETDQGDVTYFLHYHLRVILAAIRQMHEYLARKSGERRAMETLLESAAPSLQLNHRQVAVIGHLLRHPQTRPTIASHRNSHRVTYQTARTDLLRLAEMGSVQSRKRGRAFEFSLALDAQELLKTTKLT